MRPFVHLFGPRLDRLRPLAILLDVRHATGDQDPHDFFHRDSSQVLRNEKVDEVVSVRQALRSPLFNGDLAVQAERPDVLAGLLDVLRIGVQSVNQVAVTSPQSRRRLTVAATNVHGQPALDAGRGQNLPRILPLSARILARPKHCRAKGRRQPRSNRYSDPG